MAIESTYRELLIEQILKDILFEGKNPSASEIENRLKNFIKDHDISRPLFIANNYKVETEEISSAKKTNDMNNSILQDLKVLYKHLFKISDQSLNNYERWRSEAKLLEGRLDRLDQRITSLLLLNLDTAGFFNFVQDNFTDNSFVDLSETSAFVNIAKGIVTLGTNSIGPTRIDLNDLREEDIEFTILTRKNLVSIVSASESNTKHVVTDQTNFWQERVYTNKPGPVSVELKINLLIPRSISRIDIDLHQSNANSTVQITPMLSEDNFNFKQLPISSFTRSIFDKSTFQFEEQSNIRWIKFIVTKAGFDQIQDGLYSYEFGVDEISFYNEAFQGNIESILISKPLFVKDTENNPEEFNKIVLEVCEEVPDDTIINYSVAVFNDINEIVSSNSYVSIDPVNRDNPTNPTILDFGDLDLVSISGIKISFDPTDDTVSINDPTISGIFINPAKNISFVNSISGSSALISNIESSAPRYSFLNSNDRILDYQLNTNIKIAQGTLELWRNINLKGDETLVRGISNGWGFLDPYYNTTVMVENLDGVEIDFGGQSIIVDNVIKNGKVFFSYGRHIISVHKNNWKIIDISQISNLISLKQLDLLYPYNHKYLIEGLLYPSVFPSTDEKIYRGFDIVAELFMKQVSVFDMINNVISEDYGKFCIDTDSLDESAIIDSIPEIKNPTSIFLLKVLESNPDFINEKFLLRFKSANTLYKYIKFKAALSTSNTNVAPFLDSYRIKISS